MANMSYCRFENTFEDFQDCVEHMEEDLSESEEYFRDALITLCCDIAASYCD